MSLPEKVMSAFEHCCERNLVEVTSPIILPRCLLLLASSETELAFKLALEKKRMGPVPACWKTRVGCSGYGGGAMTRRWFRSLAWSICVQDAQRFGKLLVSVDPAIAD